MNQEFAAKAAQMMKSYGFEIGMMVIPTDEDHAYQIMAIDEIKTIKNGMLHLRVMEASPLRTLKTIEAKNLIEFEFHDYLKVSSFTNGTIVIYTEGYGKVLNDEGHTTRQVLINGEERNIPLRNLSLPNNAKYQEMKRKIRDISSNETFLGLMQTRLAGNNNRKRIGDFC
jgi:hypothetical protein